MLSVREFVALVNSNKMYYLLKDAEINFLSSLNDIIELIVEMFCVCTYVYTSGSSCFAISMNILRCR